MSAQHNLIFNGDFTKRTELFDLYRGGDVHRNLVGWEEVNTPDYWGRDTVDGISDFVVMILSLHHIEMITNQLKENLVVGCEYEFTFLAYTKNRKNIPITLLFPHDTDIIQNQVDVYRLIKKRQVVKLKKDPLGNRKGGYAWRLYSAKFVAREDHSRIIIGNTLFEKPRIYSTRIADLKLYPVKVSKENGDGTMKFKE